MAKRKRTRAKKRKLKRAQPRSKTPPVSFRGAVSGELQTLLIDEELRTIEWTNTRTRQPIFLRLAPGLTVHLESRRVDKRRYPCLRIQPAASPATWPDPSPEGRAWFEAAHAASFALGNP